MTENTYFILKYKACGAECPIRLSGKFNQPKWEWNVFETKPNDVTIVKDYEFTVTDREIKSLEFDFYGAHTKFASRKFLKICDDLNVKYRAIPLKFIVRKKEVDKEYFIFLPVDHLPLMDKETSTFTEARDAETGELLVNKIYSDQVLYNDITKFITSKEIFPHVFQCSEILELVCTREFMQIAMERDLKCIDFIPIDANFKFDPWAIAPRYSQLV